MNSLRRKRSLIGASAVLAFTLLPTVASSITAELAKKCRAMAITAYPTVLAGNRKGSAENQREFFQRCVDRNGDIAIPAAVPAPRCPCRRRVKQETSPMPPGPPRTTAANAGRTRSAPSSINLTDLLYPLRDCLNVDGDSVFRRAWHWRLANAILAAPCL
jgi:hypothetical protein